MTYAASAHACRRAAVACCPTWSVPTTTIIPPLNTAPLYVKAGDTIDFGVLWGAFLNTAGLKLTASVWAAAAAGPASPQAPSIVEDSSKFSADTGETAFLLNASAAANGDRYLIDNTITVDRDPVASEPALPVGARTIVRRLDIRVVLG